MAEERPNLDGAWKSRYEYGDGKSSEHIIDLRQNGLKVDGSSRLDPTGSELFLHLLLSANRRLGGDWEEITSREGEYGGQRFKGFVAFVLKSEGVWEGVWIGPNRDDSKVNSGPWTLEKQKDENAEV